MTVEPYRWRPGSSPLLVSMPHVGTHVPADLAAGMTAEALALPDTDWHVDRLYDFVDDLGASVLAGTHARYVVDLNRPPDDQNLYPDRPTPGLVPLHTFDGQPIHRPGAAPDTAEVARRLEVWWQPYHRHLATALDHLRAVHGTALLFEAHSIRPRVPRLWDGELPHLNLGTGGGTACAPEIAAAMLAVAREASDYTAVLDGRFQGGYITRHYGDPARGVHAIQLELSQATYLELAGEPRLDEERAARIRPVLRRLLETLLSSHHR